MVPREIDATAFSNRPFRRYIRDITAISPRNLQQLSVKSVDAVSMHVAALSRCCPCRRARSGLKWACGRPVWRSLADSAGEPVPVRRRP